MFGTNRERSIGNSFSMSSLFPNFVPKWAWAARDSPFFHSRHQLERPFLLVTRSTNLNDVLRRVALSLQSRPQSPLWVFSVPQDKGNVGSGDEIAFSQSLAHYYAHLLNNKTTDEKISSLWSRKKMAAGKQQQKTRSTYNMFFVSRFYFTKPTNYS